MSSESADPSLSSSSSNSSPPIDDEAQYAALNQVIYSDRSTWADQISKIGMEEWEVHDDSQDNTMVLVNHKKKRSLVVHSGTDLKRRKTEDLITDAFISFDLTTLSPRYKQSKKITEKVMKRYPDYKLVTTGFSLGGAVANQIGHELDIESHSFNPGISPNVFRRQLTGLTSLGKRKLSFFRSTPEPVNTKHNLYITEGDWISNSGYLGIRGNENIKFNTSKESNQPHSIFNWIPSHIHPLIHK